MTSPHPAGEQRFALPWPPSTNNLYLNVRGRGRVISPKYRAWREEAGWTLAAQHPAKCTVPVEIIIELNPPTKQRFDIDNRGKAMIDLLVLHGVIPADDTRWVRSATSRVVDTGAPCTVIVRAA